MTADVKQRLEELDPLFRDLGTRTIQAYSDAGIPGLVDDENLPIADAIFTRKQDRFVYHLRGPAYLYVSRSGELKLAGQEEGASLPQALAGYVRLGRHSDLDDLVATEGATEWFPPPRFLLVEETSGLYIASVSAHTHQHPGPGFETLAGYVDERAQQFITGFREALSS